MEMTQGMYIAKANVILSAKVFQPPVRSIDVKRSTVIVNEYPVGFLPLTAAHLLVVITRARKGLIICVPEGNANKTVGGFWEDNTRIPEYYDGTYSYLKSLGLIEL